MAIKPEYPSARRHLAIALAKLGMAKGAQREFRKTGEIVLDRYPKLNRDFSRFLRDRRRIPEAKEEMKKAISILRKKERLREANELEAEMRAR